MTDMTEMLAEVLHEEGIGPRGGCLTDVSWQDCEHRDLHTLDARLIAQAGSARGLTLLPAEGLEAECPECGEGIRHRWPCSHVLRCDEPGCDREVTCGWPTKGGNPARSGDPESDGYRRTCGDHYRAALHSESGS